MESSFSINQSSKQLSPEELLAISLEINQDFAPVLRPETTPKITEETLTTQELLGISQIISSGFAPSIKNTKPEVVLMPIDPEHVHAYWHLPESEPQQKAETLTEHNYTTSPELTLSLHPLEDTHPDDPKYAWLDFFINNRQGQQTLTLPNHSNSQHYYASLNQTNSELQQQAPVTSNITQVPQQHSQNNLADCFNNSVQIFQPIAKRCPVHRPSSPITQASGQNFTH